MKKVVSGKILRDKMKESIDLLCDTVKVTLGPKGNNVIIDHSDFSPFITNDGVTIATNIQSDDEVCNTILEIAKESSIKTDQEVGDGTTTTLVILQSLFNSCLELVDSGDNPIVLKKELDYTLKNILELLNEEKYDIDKNSISNIARVSSNDKEIGNIVGEIMESILMKEAIKIKEVDDDVLKVNYYKGYTTDIILPSPFFLKNNKSVNYQDSLMIIIDDEINDMEEISLVLNETIKNNNSLIIVANDFSSYFVNQLLTTLIDDDVKCALVKISQYGVKYKQVQKDLEVISGAKIINNINNINLENIGKVKDVTITKEYMNVNFEVNESVREYVDILNEEERNLGENFDKEFYKERIAMFTSGVALILLGAPTKTELREKRMRLQDAICAASVAGNGFLIGGGVSLLKISSKLLNSDKISSVWKSALEKPFEQIMINSGESIKDIKNAIIDSNYLQVYNVYSNQFESIKDTYLIDSYDVLRKALINACSIAGMLLTTRSLVINEHKSDFNKDTGYQEL